MIIQSQENEEQMTNRLLEKGKLLEVSMNRVLQFHFSAFLYDYIAMFRLLTFGTKERLPRNVSSALTFDFLSITVLAKLQLNACVVFV